MINKLNLIFVLIFFVIHLLTFNCLAQIQNINEEIKTLDEKFSHVVGIVYDAKTKFSLKDCKVKIGNFETLTNENGYFEFSNILCGEYFILVTCPSYQDYTDVIKIKSPIFPIKIYLNHKIVKETELQKLNREYDEFVTKLLKNNLDSFKTSDDQSKKKSKYFSKYGLKQANMEQASKYKYSKKITEEKSKAPKISPKKGFGLVHLKVLEQNGNEIEKNARVKIATQVVETNKSNLITLHNVPVGTYDITITCEGYKPKTYKNVKINLGENQFEFLIEKIK